MIFTHRVDELMESGMSLMKAIETAAAEVADREKQS